MEQHLVPFLFALLIMSGCNRSDVKIYNASDFGIEPDRQTNVTPLVAAAIETIKQENPEGQPTQLIFKKGVYHFELDSALTCEYYISNHDQDNPKTMGIVLENLKNFTLNGSGPDFLFKGRMLPISLVGCENCTLQNFSIDNPNPQISQVQVLSNDTLKGVITYKIAPWVTYRLENGKFIAYGENWEQTPTTGIAFEQKSKRLVYHTSDIDVATDNVEEIEPRVIKANWDNKQLGHCFP